MNSTFFWLSNSLGRLGPGSAHDDLCSLAAKLGHEMGFGLVSGGVTDAVHGLHCDPLSVASPSFPCRVACNLQTKGKFLGISNQEEACMCVLPSVSFSLTL